MTMASRSTIMRLWWCRAPPVHQLAAVAVMVREDSASTREIGAAEADSHSCPRWLISHLIAWHVFLFVPPQITIDGANESLRKFCFGWFVDEPCVQHRLLSGS
jgi:hypothetical protein